MDIILIHIGDVFPEYINDCISQLKKYNYKIHLIIDKELFIFLNMDNNIILSDINEYIDDYFINYKNNYDSNFRNGFWLSTTKRFFILKNYAIKNNILNFLHIEYDVLLYTDLSIFCNFLHNTTDDMSVVIDSNNRCIPSIMWFRDSEILIKLSEFILKNSNDNDMGILFKFFNDNDNVSNLPLIPDINLEDVLNVKNNTNIIYSNYFEKSKSVFDGAAIGQYLGGVDPRNNSNDSVGFINETTIFDVSKFKYIWISNEPYMVYNDMVIKINNLHIHSKKLKKFI